MVCSCKFQVYNNFFCFWKNYSKILIRVNLLVFNQTISTYIYYARYLSSYAQPLKICEVCNFGAIITGSLCERFGDLNINWSLVFVYFESCKTLQIFIIWDYTVDMWGGFQTLTVRKSISSSLFVSHLEVICSR